MTKTPPLVSVVMPTYNCAEYIAEAVKSVLDQDYPALELIVVDDGSTDRTAEIVAAFPADRVTYRRRANSGGPAAPRNAGVALARGRYVAFLDADDVMLPGKLAPAVELLERDPALGFVFGDFVKFDAKRGQHPGTFLDGYAHFRALPKRKVGEAQYVIKGRAAYDGLLSENFVGVSGVVMPKRMFDRLGPLDETLAGPDDFDMWLRISAVYDVGFVDRVGHRYRVRGDSLTAEGDGRMLPGGIKALRKQLEAHPPRDAREKIRANIAFRWWELGYDHQLRGAPLLARRCYAQSILYGLYWRPLKGILATLLPSGWRRRA